jgi:hypothetical protein
VAIVTLWLLLRDVGVAEEMTSGSILAYAQMKSGEGFAE